MKDQKALEKRQFDLFQSRMAELQDIPFDHRDGPDFRGPWDGGILGIELRSLYKSPPSKCPPQAIAGYQNEILAEAESVALRRGTPPCRVLVNWFGIPIPGKSHSKLAHDLARIIHIHIPSHIEALWRTELNGCDFEEIENHISSITLTRLPELDENVWENHQGQWVMRDCSQLLQKGISNKAEKYSAYRKHCNACWLLLIGDYSETDQAIAPCSTDLNRTYLSPFDRTYFFNVYHKEPVRLTTNRNGNT